jgi:glycosyltransferase involved in cell wall biosynthesis
MEEWLHMAVPLVSVHMITYNHAPFIAKSIEGVLNQKTSFPFELVIGEDCSTDGTREIVFKYENEHLDIIRVITSDKNVGAHENDLRTTAVCRGKYVAFCEGDDYWHHTEKLQKQVEYLESHPECGMVFADCDIYDQNSQKFARQVRYTAGYRSLIKIDIEQILGDQKLCRWPWTCSAIVRRDFYEKIIESDPYLFLSKTFLLSDVSLWAELSLVGDVIYMPESLATYRVNDESASHSRDPRKHLLFWKSVCEMKMYLCDKHHLSKDLRRTSESLWREKSIQLAFLNRDSILASEVRRKNEKFTWKERLWYYGAKSAAAYYLVRIVTRSRHFFKRGPRQAISSIL